MSRKDLSGMTAKRLACAAVFAALGDKTRLLLVSQLCGGQPRSISQLREGSRLTRQAITKHLRVLEALASCAASGGVERADFNMIRKRSKDSRGISTCLPAMGSGTVQIEVIGRALNNLESLRLQSPRDHRKGALAATDVPTNRAPVVRR